MTPRQRAELAQSKRRERLGALIAIETRSDAEMAELVRITDVDMPAGEVELRAAIAAGDPAPVVVKPTDDTDPKLVELRSACSVSQYLANFGRSLSGAESELNTELGLADNQIPFDMWAPKGNVEHRSGIEERAVTAAPSTVGVNLDLFPAIFAPSASRFLMVEMPQVASGTYATAKLTSGTAPVKAAAKGVAIPEVSATWTVASTTPHRVGASIGMAIEDIAAVGAGDFEAMLRSYISDELSSELDRLLINGDPSTTAPETKGLIDQITPSVVAAATLPTFDQFLGEMVAGVDGLWASTMRDIALLVNPLTYRLAAATFRDATNHAGSVSFADYAAEMTAGFATNQRMPDEASNVAVAILCRKGRSMEPDPVRTAVMPSWNFVSIDDIYTGAKTGQRSYVVSALVGDLLLIRSDAYAVRQLTTSL